MGGATVDDEPSLGSLDSRMSQAGWGLVDPGCDCSDLASQDYEHDDADPVGEGIDTDEREHDPAEVGAE